MLTHLLLQPVLVELAVLISDTDTLTQAINLYLDGATVEFARGVTTPPITTYRFYKELDARGIDRRGKISQRKEVPKGTLMRCKSCDREKPTDAFSKHSQSKGGYDVSRCKACKKAKQDWSKTPLEKRIYNRTKSRAQKKGIPFELELSDIVLPEVCPVFKKPFIYGDHSWTYSIDRIVPELGYISGNIMIISNKANMMKSAATVDEIRLLYEWVQTL